MTTERLRIAVEGVVQGVGFRPFVYGLADRLGVRGFVANRAGDVVIEAEAERAALERFLEELQACAPGRVDRVTTETATVVGEGAFQIQASVTGSSAAAIAPDIATCATCVEEVLDPASRRFGYAFTSCASCGPRLTIVTAAPYDRARTTMAAFPLCDACRAEHDDVTDRRFHAQPIACPACGPHLAMLDEDGDAIALAASVIENGGIVAIKGLGGYHLACDATRSEAVGELRRRKERDAKPFAVMVADVASAHGIVELGAADEALLASPARPIVLAPKRGTGGLAPEVAPGVADLGVMLPYTPLHHLLLRAVGDLPLVMTSGNVSDEPIAYRDDDARVRLGAIADRFLVHDREIHMRCEDSVARVLAGAPTILRRARGYAPSPMRLPFHVDVPTLALGGHLKAAFALGVGDVAFVSPHFGDLDDLSAYEAFVAGLAHFQTLHRITPVRTACDLHPDYATTRIAEALGLPCLAVQHHHAHFASALADANLAGPAIGVIFDGAGYGTDGAIWGGEILVGDRGHVERAAHLAYVPQPGGDRAAREPWRMAIAHCLAAGEPIDRLAAAIGPNAHVVAALCEAPSVARTSSIGRLFDAVAALVGLRNDASFEGQPAMRLEALARRTERTSAYPFDARGTELHVAPMIRAICDDVRTGVAADVIARRFHTTIVELAATVCERIASETGIRDVVLSGGVFQNAILANELPRRLARSMLQAHVHRRVPPNDGGLALGQLGVIAGVGGA